MKSIKWKNLFDKVKALYDKYVTEPLKKRKEKTDYNKKISDIKKDFEKRFNINIDWVNKIMAINAKNDEQFFSKRERMTEDLIAGRINTINAKTKSGWRTPFFYDPEICDIHNEHLNLKAKTIEQISSEDLSKSQTSLKAQAKAIGQFERKEYPVSSESRSGYCFRGMATLDVEAMINAETDTRHSEDFRRNFIIQK